jgi:hypothetical protein
MTESVQCVFERPLKTILEGFYISALLFGELYVALGL